MHRPPNGRIKNLTMKYDAGEWYTIFVCELPDQPKVPIEGIPEDHLKGGDLGLALGQNSVRPYPQRIQIMKQGVGE